MVNVYNFLIKEIMEPKKNETILYFQEKEIHKNEFENYIEKNYSREVERILRENELNSRLVPNSYFEGFMGVAIESTYKNNLIENTNKLYNMIKEEGVPIKNIANVVIDPNGVWFDLSQGDRKKEREIFKNALEENVTICGKNEFMVNLPIKEDTIYMIIKALEEVRKYIVKKQELNLLEYYNVQ